MRTNKSIIIVLLVSFVFIISGCAKKESVESTQRSDVSNSVKSEKVSQSFEDNSDSKGVIVANDKDISKNAKVIINGYVEMECVDYEKTIENLKNYISKTKGYISSSDIQGVSISQQSSDLPTRVARISVRIPKNGHDIFVKGLKDFGQITLEKITSEDITLKYFDTDARINSLKVQELRLLELFKKAEKIADIIIIEDKLRAVRGEIESMTSSIKQWDNQIDYSTLELSIREVKRYQEIKTVKDGFFTKLVVSFKESIINLRDIIQVIVLTIVYLIPYFIVISILFLLVRKTRGRFSCPFFPSRKKIKD